MIENSKFFYNQAQNGGAIFIDNAHLIIKHTEFKQN